MGYKENQQKRLHKVFWGSSYDRGLDVLLFMWPDIVDKYPDAELHICYGWDMFLHLRRTNPERMQWKQNVDQMMEQEGIIHHGKVGKKELQEIRRKCGIWAYPTYFTEINCITALECQNDGVVPVTMDDFALSETVGSGIKIKGSINSLEVQDKFKEKLIKLMGNPKMWEEESKKGQEFAKNYKWEKLAPKWVEFFKEPVSKPEVSVITVTNRTGFWNIMAKNLSKQTYKIKEWIVVDDYEKDQGETAKKYAQKYGVNIVYLRGNKTRKNGLVVANNIGWKAARGELLVYLQDFILIPENGIEMLVDVYRHHPDSLIAPVDEYFFTKDTKREGEDWWNGETNIVTDFSWRNVRQMHSGVRESENPYDFEMNYGAIPKKILDDLNGWWEFFDEGIGYDNTEIAYRALKAGYKLVIDDRNIAICLDLFPKAEGSENLKRFEMIQDWEPKRDERRDIKTS